VEELVSQITQRMTRVVEQQVSTVESRPEPSATIGAEEPVAAQVEEEAPAEAGLIDIASILGAPTVTVVRSNL
jgi:predicted secreted protein